MAVYFPIAFTTTFYSITAASQWTDTDNSSIAIGELYTYHTITSTLFRSWHPEGPNIRWIAVGF